MKIFASIVTLALVCWIVLFADGQTLKQKQLDYLAEHKIELVDSARLYKDLLKENGKVKMVVIFTNYCVGTPYIFTDIKKYQERFGDKIEFILCSSAPKNELEDLVKVLQSHNYTDKVYYIDPDHYKEYRSDDRKKGFQFRNEICAPCRKDEIGTPYRVFFGPSNDIIFYGYASRNDFDQMLSDYFNKRESGTQ